MFKIKPPKSMEFSIGVTRSIGRKRVSKKAIEIASSNPISSMTFSANYFKYYDFSTHSLQTCKFLPNVTTSIYLKFTIINSRSLSLLLTHATSWKKIYFGYCQIGVIKQAIPHKREYSLCIICMQTCTPIKANRLLQAGSPEVVALLQVMSESEIHRAYPRLRMSPFVGRAASHRLIEKYQIMIEELQYPEMST